MFDIVVFHLIFSEARVWCDPNFLGVDELLNDKWSKNGSDAALFGFLELRRNSFS